MSSLFTALRRRVDDNARRAVELYTAELPEFRVAATNAASHDDMVDFAVLLRRREAELAAEDQPFTDGDLAVLREFGEERGAAGVSLAAQQRVLVLHSVLTLREIQEAAGPADSADLMRMLGWLPTNGLAAQNAYTEGYLAGQKRFLPAVQRVQRLARMLLADSPVAADAAASLGMPLASRYVVAVVRIPSAPVTSASDRRDEVVESILKHHRVPITWHEPDELVVLLPAGDNGSAVEERALRLVREFASLVGRPCAAGAASGQFRQLAEALALARQISRAAPLEAEPRGLHTMPDVFVELGVAQLGQAGDWLRELGRQLSAGPDLVTTVDAFYQHGMNRLRTASALHVHPRTLDYRLRRVRELTGVDPASVRGVRILSTAVTFILAGTWD